MRLAQLYRHPVKSCRGQSLTEAQVLPWGLDGDRRWMVVDTAGEAVTARVHPRMVLVIPELVPDGIVLTAPGRPALPVSAPSEGAREVTVFGQPVPALDAGDAAAGWFADYLGIDVRLAYQADPLGRSVSPEFGLPTDTVTFADAYPLLVVTLASLDALNGHIAAGPLAAEGPLPIRRFRPNVVVDGAQPWAEDGWRRVRIGDVTFRAVKGCSRCVLTTVDPDTAVKGKEPIASLARHRRWDGKTWFGMNLIPDSPGKTIRVGDRVEILQSVPGADGPPR